MYESIGGLDLAGYPSSDPESYRNFWQGKRQTFVLLGTDQTYALMQARSQEEIYLLPPAFYAAYIDQDGLDRLGYPLSSFPLDPDAGDDNWIARHDIEPATAELLRLWRTQPHQIQIFQKGSLWRDATSGQPEVVEKLKLVGDVTKLSGEVGGFRR